MSNNRKRVTVEQWITEALSDPDKGKPCNMLALSHVKMVGTEEVHSKAIEGPQNFKGLADFFINKACAYSQDLTGVQSFRLQAFYNANEPQASFTFTVFEGNLTAGEAAPWSKHEPTPTGLLAQLMKNNEFLMSQNTTLTQGFTGMLMAAFVEHNKEKAEMHMILRDVLLNMRKEDHAMRLEQLKFERESTERAMMGKAMPALMNYITGREVVPEQYADSQIIEAMALKTTPQHLQLLASSGMVTQEQALLLAARFTKIREEHEKRQQALKTVPSEESNAGGQHA